MSAPNYASAKFPTPRNFQVTAREKLRAGFVDGHRSQMVMAPTGSGKTILAMFLIQESLMRNKRVIFVADRRTLINQTSKVADELGLISHGVMMANHWRYNISLPFQIASAQTLARRDWPDADLIIIDEAHTQLKAWTEHVPTCRAAVIGLSATPFSTGLGKLFTNLINAATMRELTDSGYLVPMRVMTCTKIDMRGAATAGGEWTDKAAEERGMDIVGDVVHEWIKHADNRKTIVFGSTIAHCEGMAREFNSAGIMAAVFTAETKEEERKAILADFEPHDSALRVLISVEALAKGFDQKDVSCLAEESRVLTDRGEITIDKLLLSDKIWDGFEFVSHGGAIYRGEKDVITYAGLTATHDHLVKTDEGWTAFGECAKRKLSIRTTGIGGYCVRHVENIFTDSSSRANLARNEKNGAMPLHYMLNGKDHVSRALQKPKNSMPCLQGKCAVKQAGFGWDAIQWLGNMLCGSIADWSNWTKSQACTLQMQNVRGGKGYLSGSLHIRPKNWLQELPEIGANSTMGCSSSGEYAHKVPGFKEQCLSRLRQARDRIQVRFSDALRAMGFGKFRVSSTGQKYPVGPEGQRWALRAWEFTVGIKAPQRLQHTPGRTCGKNPQIPVGSSRNTIRGQDAAKSDFDGFDIRSNHNALSPEVGQAKRRVWDILNAGPRNSFTCEGLLVHNCICDVRPLRKSLSTAIQMWGRGLRASPETGKKDLLLLDFSGNIVRFSEDYETIFHDGLDALDCGEKLDKEIRKKGDEEDDKPSCCPQCSYKPFTKRCVSCGFEIIKENLVEHLAGAMQEFKIGKVTVGDKLTIWEQCATLCKGQGKPETAKQRAYYLFKSITGLDQKGMPSFDSTRNVPISRAVMNKQKANMIAFRNRKG